MKLRTMLSSHYNFFKTYIYRKYDRFLRTHFWST